MHREGKIDSGLFNDFTKWSSNALRNSANNLFGALTPQYNYDFSGFNHSPIGAFYDSRTLTTDSATSIADKTTVLFGQNQQSLSLAQLSTLDTNADGQLSGNELNTLSSWADLNENGQVDADEMKTLAQRGVVQIRAADFQFFTQCNSRLGASALAPTRPNESAGIPARVDRTSPMPSSNFRNLRDTINYFATVDGLLEWAPNQVKIQYNQQHYLIGTDGDDSFNANYYAAYSRYFNINLLTHFLAGGGNDNVGGSVRADFIWGGTGNDALWGYAGNDSLYGEQGDDQLSGDEGDDYLDGGLGDDNLFGGSGADVLVGDAGADYLSGEAGDDYLYGESGADELVGGAGNDYLDGGDDNDLLSGGHGRRYLVRWQWCGPTARR